VERQCVARPYQAPVYQKIEMELLDENGLQAVGTAPVQDPLGPGPERHVRQRRQHPGHGVECGMPAEPRGGQGKPRREAQHHEAQHAPQVPVRGAAQQRSSRLERSPRLEGVQQRLPGEHDGEAGPDRDVDGDGAGAHCGFPGIVKQYTRRLSPDAAPTAQGGGRMSIRPDAM
jgi:hypothetical protein